MFENPRRGRQARSFITNVQKILDLKLSSEQIFSKNWRWVTLLFKENIAASWRKEKNYASYALSTDSASNAPKSGRVAWLTTCVLHASFDRSVTAATPTKTSLKKCHAYSMSFNSSNVGNCFWSWILMDCIKVQEKKKKVVFFCSRPRQNVKLGSFTL